MRHTDVRRQPIRHPPGHECGHRRRLSLTARPRPPVGPSRWILCRPHGGPAGAADVHRQRGCGDTERRHRACPRLHPDTRRLGVGDSQHHRRRLPTGCRTHHRIEPQLRCPHGASGWREHGRPQHDHPSTAAPAWVAWAMLPSPSSPSTCCFVRRSASGAGS